MYLNKSEKKVIGTAKVTSRTITGILAAPIKLIALLGSLFLILAILVGALFLTKYINDNYTAFQEKLRNDSDFADVIINLLNTVGGLINVCQKVLQIAVEIWDYTVPSLNLAAYIFYRVVIAVLLTLFGGGINQDPSDQGDAAMPLGTPDPVGTLTGDTETFFSMLECILIDVLTLAAGVFKVFMRALGACLMVVFEWLDENLKKIWFRQEYCRRGGTGKMGATADWTNPYPDPDGSGKEIYPDGSGPGNTCPDNSMIIQALIRFATLVVNLARDVFILVFPIIADLLKMVFDALLKILPQLMEGIVKIIEIFGPNQPLGKFLMFIINFMIQVLGFFLKSCVLQLMIGIVMCLFNVVSAVVVNAIRGVLEILISIVCLGGVACDPDVPGDYVNFPSCSWSSFTDCVEQNYDSQQRDVSAICQIPTCSSHLKTTFHGMHKGMKMRASRFDDPMDYQVEYHKSCVQAHISNHSSGEETVAGHLFCRYLTEEVHKPVPLGIDPDSVPDPFEQSEDFCGEVQESCLCKYNSPICESQTCCLTYYSVLVQQMLQDLEMAKCDTWNERATFAQMYCVSRTQRSLDLGLNDLLGTATHCDGFVALVNQTCFGKPNGTEIDIKGIVGGMCKWVDQAGFCDSFRRPKSVPESIDKIAEFYNDHILHRKEQRKKMRMGMSGEKPTRNPHPETSPNHHLRDYPYLHAEIEDHYTVALFTMAEAFPAIMGMVLRPSYAQILGLGVSEVSLDHDYVMPDGKLRHVRLAHNWDWQDYHGVEIRSVYTNGTKYDWHFMGSVPPTPYNDAGCTSQNTGGYPDAGTYNCQKNRITQTVQQTGGSITALVGPGQGQDKVDDMIANSSQPINEKTTTRPTFSGPSNQYVDWMYNYNMQTPSHVDPSADAQRQNQNDNWREPLRRKNSSETQNRPGGGGLYGSSQRRAPTLEECPVPTDFPWQRVFGKRETFLTPLKEFIQNIPQWAEKTVPEKPSIEIPKEIKDALYLISKRKNNLPKDVSSMTKAWKDAFKSFRDLKDSWDIMRASKPKENSQTAQQEERWWGTSLKGMPVGSNPSFLHNAVLGSEQNTTELCINKLLNPYQCCTDTASAYECCYGLIGCIPPPPLLNITRIENLHQIANATCSGTTNVVMSLFFLPRMIFGTWLWTLIFISPPWLRVTEFKILYPLVYDYGGLGISENFLGDMFCFIVNLYYPILAILICFGIYVLDAVFLQTWREMIMKADITFASVSAAGALEYSEVHIKNLESQVQALEQQIHVLQRHYPQ